MAKNNSFIRLEGTLDGLTFYRQNGNSFVKTKGGVSRNRVLNDRAFKRTRENMTEFGGCAKASKAFRDSYGSVMKLMADPYISSRVTGLMKYINKNGSGERGERSIDIASNAEVLNGLELNRNLPLNSVFYAPVDAPVLSADRDSVTVTIPDFSTDTYINAPEGASHFRLVLASGLVSNYEYEPILDRYEPTDEELNALGSSASSVDIKLGGMVGSATTLTVDLGVGSAVPATVSNFIGLGIIFYQEINGSMYELASGNCMKVLIVG